MEFRIDKRALVDALRERLTAELGRSTGQAVDAAAGATHEENSAEGDKDMRSTEASYVARGHAERVQVLKEALVTLGAMTLREFRDGDRIASSAVVDLTYDGREHRYFLLPVAGGERLELGAGMALSTLAATSPLGLALLGLTAGDEAEVATPGGTRIYEVTRVR
ncbi:MAG TPA: GreA/GreB family elongation factor [Polyangiaceae bacterium]